MHTCVALVGMPSSVSCMDLTIFTYRIPPRSMLMTLGLRAAADSPPAADADASTYEHKGMI